MAVECPYCETTTGDMDLLHDHLGDAHDAFARVARGDLAPLVDAALTK